PPAPRSPRPPPAAAAAPRCGPPPRAPAAGRWPRSPGPGSPRPAAWGGRPGRGAGPLFSPTVWYTSSPSTWASGSGPPAASGAALDPVAQLQQVPAAGRLLAGQLRRRLPLGDPPQEQPDLRGGAVGPLPVRAGEQVEHPAAALAPVVDHRGAAAAAVDGVPLPAGLAPGAGQAVGVEQVQEPLVA